MLLHKLTADQGFILRCHSHGVKFIAKEKVLSNVAEGGLSTRGNCSVIFTSPWCMAHFLL